MLQLLNNKALITGASKGVGRELAKTLASLGCSVTVLARNETLLKENLKSLPQVSNHQQHSYIKYDLEELIKIKSSPTISQIEQELVNLSILINCAGITNHSLLSRTNPESIISTINLNLTVPILLSKLATKPMLKVAAKRKKDEILPVIVNVSSVLSFTGMTAPGTSVYAALKAGILGFTESLASELKGRVRVNTIVPGLIKETEMGQNATITGDNVPVVELSTVVSKVVEIIKDSTINGQNIVLHANSSTPIVHGSSFGI